MPLSKLDREGVFMSNTGVHATHCCGEHGCKYGDHDCPVVLGQVEQRYVCEECEDFDLRVEAAMHKAVELGVLQDTAEQRQALRAILKAAI